MIRAEYLRFLQTLTSSSMPNDVCKIANLVERFLDELVPLSVHNGQRIKQFVRLASENWNTISSKIQPIIENPHKNMVTFSELKSMTVGPFRGFAREETFDLANRVVLLYGPNGAGKSSFFEALEYGLLGNVAEAENRRFQEQNKYLKNAYVNKFVPPNITAKDKQGNEIVITPNEEAYRFCFVEKNRIDSFSRIAAQAPAKQTALISTLFGLELFTEFVRNFTDEIGPKYIELVGNKATQLTEKQSLISSANYIISQKKNEIQEVTSDELELANKYRAGICYERMLFEINGNEEYLGQIKCLDQELQQPIAQKSNLTNIDLEALKVDIGTIKNELNTKLKYLSDKSQQVSFKQLYEAVIQVQQGYPDVCPACNTSLKQVTINPYTHAEQELQKLQELATIQQEIEALEQNLRANLFKISQIINTVLNHYSKNNCLQGYQVSNNQAYIQWWDSLHVKLADGCSPWQHLETQVQHLETADKNIDVAIQNRTEKQTKLNQLRDYGNKINIFQALKESANKAITSAEELINNFQNENTQLIADVEVEKNVIKMNQEIVSAYIIFVKSLNKYHNDLPAQLVANLEGQVVELYNTFNRNDPPTELLAEVKLPVLQNQRLTISFKNKSDTFHDALHVLSEGHIRCLGLAILLAKNLKENAPALIFDDPVNAIDDDHRESIRQTLFKDSYFLDKQILLTCHGEEFFKDIQNLLPANKNSQPKLYSFLPRNDGLNIRVDFNCAQRNYILAAREHLDKNEIRDALTKSRKALEALTKNKVWKYVHKYGDGYLSLKFRSLPAPVELRNLTEQLKKKIEDKGFLDQKKQAIDGPLGVLLGMSGNSREWSYLNKGTHEENDRAEFDRATVELIVGSLEQLDNALT